MTSNKLNNNKLSQSAFRLQGGRYHRRRKRTIWLLLLLLLVFVAIFIVFVTKRSSGHESRRLAAQHRHQKQQRPNTATSSAGLSIHTVNMDLPEGYGVKLASTPQQVHMWFTPPPRSGLLFNIDTGEVLWQHNPDRRLPIASITKIMTAIVTAENSTPTDRVRITRKALNYQGSGVGVLPLGKNVPLESLLYGLLLPSGNDAALALAEHIGGTIKGFIEIMNLEAENLGLTCTHFSTPNGFQDAGNYSCMRDLAVMTTHLLHNNRLQRIVRHREATVRFPIKGGKLFLYNTNPLLKQHYPGVTGLKTGYTNKAGRSLIATAKHGNTHLGVILLHSPDPAAQARQLLDRGFVRMHSKLKG